MAQRRKKQPESSEETPESNPERVERFTENLPVVLTDAEVADRAQRAAHRLADRDHIEEELRAYNKTEKSRISRIESELRNLSEEVRSKTTYRDISCERRYCYRTLRVYEVRLDTGETIAERAMNEQERQRQFEFEAPKGEDLDEDFEDDAAAQ